MIVTPWNVRKVQSEICINYTKFGCLTATFVTLMPQSVILFLNFQQLLPTNLFLLSSLLRQYWIHMRRWYELLSPHGTFIKMFSSTFSHRTVGYNWKKSAMTTYRLPIIAHIVFVQILSQNSELKKLYLKRFNFCLWRTKKYHIKKKCFNYLALFWDSMAQHCVRGGSSNSSSCSRRPFFRPFLYKCFRTKSMSMITSVCTVYVCLPTAFEIHLCFDDYTIVVVQPFRSLF